MNSSDVHVVKGRILLCSCGEMTEPAKGPGEMWRAFEAHQALAAAGGLDVHGNHRRRAARVLVGAAIILGGLALIVLTQLPENFM